MKTNNEQQELELFPEIKKMPVFWANFLSPEKITINQGGTSSSKSHSIIRVLFCYAVLTARLKIEVVAATYPKLQGDTLEIAEDLFYTNSVLKFHIVSYNKTKSTFYFKNGSKIVFKAYENPKDAEGPKRHILYINEARNILWATAQKLIVRTKFKTFIDYNPTAEFWAHDKIIKCKPGRNNKKQFSSVKVIRSWHVHNAFIDQDKRDEIESIADPELWKAYARGLTAKIVGLVYPNVVFGIPLSLILNRKPDFYGIDYGYTNDPTCLLAVYENITYDGVLYDYLVDELLYITGSPVGFIYQTLIENNYEEGIPLYSEHDRTIIKQLRHLGVTVVRAYKNEGSVESGCLFLRTKKIAYTERSKNLEYESSRYSFLQNKSGESINKPQDRYNHGMDAKRYAIFTNAVKTGKLVWHISESDEEVSL